MTEELFNIISYSPEQTEESGKTLGKYIEDHYSDFDCDNVFLALYGDVGAGKTVFVRGICSLLCPDDFVSSPTYALVNEYKGKICVSHYDMYRINNEDDLESTGFFDIKNRVIVAEWCENIPFAIPDDRIEITIERTEENNVRKIVAKRIRK